MTAAVPTVTDGAVPTHDEHHATAAIADES